MNAEPAATDAPAVSVVLPVYNEEPCIAGVLEELCRALDGGLGRPYEVIAVDDGSTDGTAAILRAAATRLPRLRVLRLTPNAGQSAAFCAGFRAARGSIVVTMDADGQNDPADIPALLQALEHCDVCCGYRRNRQDTRSKRLASKVANRIRNRVLHEDIIDTGCTLKAFRAPLVKDLTMWRGLHRFLPSLMKMKGAAIVQIPVNHRPRTCGQSKYTNCRRLRETIGDLRAVRWMQKRNRRYEILDG